MGVCTFVVYYITVYNCICDFWEVKKLARDQRQLKKYLDTFMMEKNTKQDQF